MPILLSQFIEACRWVGALLVVAVHSTNLFVNLSDIMSAPHAASVYAWWFFVSFELGHQAVVGFFVISGYLVGGAALAHVRKSAPFLREYLIHRFARIYVVLVPALFVTLALDWIGRSFVDPGVYGWPIFENHLRPGLFFGALANLTTIYSDFFGTNGPMWSLACEFWYYVTFPLLLLPWARCYSPALRAAGFALGVGMIAALAIPDSWFRLGYILWVIGALATLAPRPLIRSRLLAAAIYVAAVVPIRLLVRGPILETLPWLPNSVDLLSGLLFVNLAITLRFGSQEGWALFRPRFHKQFADFSFSLYSIHLPLLVFCRSVADRIAGPGWAREMATSAHWLALGVVMTVAMVAGFGFSRLTEAHTGAARRALRALLGAPPRQPAAAVAERERVDA
jgi:peptidoglycan/LPS O-acetylase OafA/YrhL